MDAFIKEIINEHVTRRVSGLCPACGLRAHVEDMKDELSVREFSISGLCQTCQDDFFEEEEE